MTETTLYALFKDGKQVSKAHSTRNAVITEAHELGVVFAYHADMPGDVSGRDLAAGYKIQEVA